MNRRHFLGVLATCSIGLAGCGGSGVTDTATPPKSTVERASPDGCLIPTTEPITVQKDTPTPSLTGDVSGGLSITANYQGPLTVILTRLPRDETGEKKTVFVEMYDSETTLVALRDEMQDQFDYEVEIRSDCDVFWTKTIYSYEQYSITIQSDGEVAIDQHLES